MVLNFILCSKRSSIFDLNKTCVNMQNRMWSNFTRHFTLTAVTHLALGTAPQEFLRWSMHASQELHSCSGVWSTICHSRRGQFTLTLRSANLLCHASYRVALYDLVIWDSKWSPLLLFLDEAERLPTWLPRPLCTTRMLQDSSQTQPWSTKTR